MAGHGTPRWEIGDGSRSPSPLAKFRVLEEETARLLDRLAREHPDSHLLLGLLYAQAGVRAEAEGHLTKVQPADGYFEVAQRTRERLRSAGDPEKKEQ